MPEKYARGILAGTGPDARRRAPSVRSELAQAFRRIALTLLEPAFQQIAAEAAAQGVECSVDVELNGVQPRVMFIIRPSGRSLRYSLDTNGDIVREIEGVYHRPLGQRMFWTETEQLQRQLTAGYARLAARAVVEYDLIARSRAEAEAP